MRSSPACQSATERNLTHMVCVSLYFLDEKGVVHAEINWFVLGQIIIAG